MVNIVIGEKGFISSQIKKSFTDSRKIKFLCPEEINFFDISSDENYKIILLSFDRVWFYQSGYDCEVEKKIIKKFNQVPHSLIYASTSKIYGNGLNLDELTPIDPQSIYAKNKLIAEKFIRNHFENHIIFRLSNVFSENNYANGSFLDTVIKNLEKKEVSFDVCKSSIRDFIHVDTLLEVFFSKEKIPSGIYNLSSGIGLRIDEILDSIIIGNEIDKNNLTFEYGTRRYSQTLSNKKIFDILGLKKIEKNNILKSLRKIKCSMKI